MSTPPISQQVSPQTSQPLHEAMEDEQPQPARIMAVMPVDLSQCMLLPGQPSRVGTVIKGRTVLARTLLRVARIEHLRGIILLCPKSQADELRALLASCEVALPVHVHEVDGPLQDRWRAMVRISRLMHPDTWRAGLGSATAYDEILCPQPMSDALRAHDATAGVLVGPDWLLIDPAITSQVVSIHAQHPQAMQMAFSQSPPGLAGVVVARGLLEQMAENGASIGQLIGYNPQRPQADPIGRDVCAQIPASVRDCPARLVYDTPRAAAMIDKLIAGWDDEKLQTADALEMAQAVKASQTSSSGTGILPVISSQTKSRNIHSALQADDGQDARPTEDMQDEFLPREVTVELTPRRAAHGPLLPQYHVKFDRPDLTLEHAQAIFKQLGQSKDTFLVLGGLGDALLHPQWREIVTMARQAGIAAICIETDLLVDQATLALLLDAPVDVISVRLNADTARTYQAVMTDGDGSGGAKFKRCLENMQWLINTRNARWQPPPEGSQGKAEVSGGASAEVGREHLSYFPGLPWIVPGLVKTHQTFGDMETFFDRWTVYTGAAVIAPHQSGCGLMPVDSPVKMTPPRRRACRQLAHRLTILSDGQVALCDQDWLARDAAGRVAENSLTQAMMKLRERRKAHEAGQWNDLPLCSQCDEWFRP